MPWRARYLLIGGVALATAAGVVGWHFFDGRGEILKPDGGPVVTVMDFVRSLPLDPLPSGWQHRKFWTRSPMSMAFAVKDWLPSMRFETHDSASMLVRYVHREARSSISRPAPGNRRETGRMRRAVSATSRDAGKSQKRIASACHRPHAALRLRRFLAAPGGSAAQSPAGARQKGGDGTSTHTITQNQHVLNPRLLVDQNTSLSMLRPPSPF